MSNNLGKKQQVEEQSCTRAQAYWKQDSGSRARCCCDPGEIFPSCGQTQTASGQEWDAPAPVHSQLFPGLAPTPPRPKCCGVPGLLPQDSIPVELWHRMCQLLRVTLSHTLPTALGTAGAGAGLCPAHAASLTASLGHIPHALTWLTRIGPATLASLPHPTCNCDFPALILCSAHPPSSLAPSWVCPHLAPTPSPCLLAQVAPAPWQVPSPWCTLTASLLQQGPLCPFPVGDSTPHGRVTAAWPATFPAKPQEKLADALTLSTASSYPEPTVLQCSWSWFCLQP